MVVRLTMIKELFERCIKGLCQNRQLENVKKIVRKKNPRSQAYQSIYTQTFDSNGKNSVRSRFYTTLIPFPFCFQEVAH